MKVKTEYFDSDTLNVKLIIPYEKIEGIDWQKNMPWIVEVFIGVLTESIKKGFEELLLNTIHVFSF